MRTVRVVVTCEHGGNRIPEAFARFFRGSRKLIHSHRGWDAGALAMARTLSRGLRAPLFASIVSRLVVDLNRSPGHQALFCRAMRTAPAGARDAALERYYLPYRRRVQQHIATEICRGARIVHISSHSFSPVLNGVRRDADIGLLYDPSRGPEAALCRRWQQALARAAPSLRVRRNYPYTGISDGHTRALRKSFPPRVYAGVELEVNQSRCRRGPRWDALCRTVLRTLREAIGRET